MTSIIISKFSNVKHNNIFKGKNIDDTFNTIIQRGGVILTCIKNFDLNLLIIKLISIVLILVTILDVLFKIKKIFNKN